MPKFSKMFIIEVYRQNACVFHAVSKWVKKAYYFSHLVGEIAEINQSYKVTNKQVNLQGKTVLFDKSRFESLDVALDKGYFVVIRYAKFIK